MSKGNLTSPVPMIKLEKFTTTEFNDWKLNTQFGMKYLNVFYTVQMDCADVMGTEDEAQWISDEDFYRDYLLNCLSSRLVKTYMKMKTAKEIWNALEAHFKQEDDLSKAHLVDKFHAFTFDDEKEILPQFRMTMTENGVGNGDHEPSSKVPKLCKESFSNLPFLKVKRLSPNAILPSRASHLSAGYDLSSSAEAKIPARGKALVPTDLSIAIPEGTYARIAPRSGLAWKHSIDVGAGVIDADYRGPVGVVLFNHSDKDFEVKLGDRIAQMIIEKIMMPEVIEINDLDSTIRGSGGFGSTGV